MIHDTHPQKTKAQPQVQDISGHEEGKHASQEFTTPPLGEDMVEIAISGPA
jgi:hypothetical protein